MPAAPAVTMQDLELENAELLPARETLWTTGSSYSYSSYSSATVAYGNTEQEGLINVSLLNGDFNNLINVGGISGSAAA